MRWRLRRAWRREIARRVTRRTAPRTGTPPRSPRSPRSPPEVRRPTPPRQPPTPSTRNATHSESATTNEQEAEHDTGEPNQRFDDAIARQAYALNDLADLASTSHLPRGIMCPITSLPMCDPVIATDGHSYERAAITKWFEQYSKTTSPITGEKFLYPVIIPNHALRETIRELLTVES